MDFEFMIPHKKEDLLNSTEGQYCPKKTDLNEAWKKIGDCKKAVGNHGCAFILDYFDILFSILYEARDVSFEQLQETWDTVIHLLLEDLRCLVQEGIRNENPEKRKYYLNSCVMSVYIFSLFFRTYEEKLSFSTDNLIVDKKSKASKSKSKLSKYDIPWDWNTAKNTAFSLINGTLQENINCLWDPQIADEQFINLIAGCCYKAFENPEIVQAKLKPLKDSVSQVLATLVSRYNHAFIFLPQCVQLLKDHEHSAPALSNAVLVMVIDYKCTSLLPKVLREITEAVIDEEVQGLGKSVATFITTLSETSPEIFLPTIKTLSRCLISEPYILRNAVLITFCDILLKCFNPENNPNEDKKVRDSLLKFLHNHLRDQSSYVRSKVLQLWAKLAAAHVIPMDYFMPVLRTAKSRLTDSSSYVVKSAIHFFIAVLKDNLYAGKFNLNDLNNQLTKAKEALKSIQNKQVPSKDYLWKLLEPNLGIQLNLILEGQNGLDANMEPPEEESVPIEDTLTIISQLLLKKHFSQAYNLLKMCERKYPDAQEIRCNLDRSDEVEYYIATFKKIFFSFTSNYNPYLEDFEHQKTIVTYLEDTIAFALLVADASKEIERPLFGQSTLEAAEAIEFFTTAYKFNAGDSRRVVRQMIILIWSKVPGIKEAISAAYKTLYLESSQSTAKGKALQAASRLIKLIKDLDYEQKSALEELIHMWVKDNDLNREFIQVLWEIFSNQISQFNQEDSICALMILDVIAEKIPLLVSLNLQVLIDNGFSDKNNLLMMEYTCKMITKLSDNKGENGKYIRLSPEHEVFQKASEVVIEKFPETPVKGFLSLSAAVLKMIYKVCWKPLQVADHLLEELYKTMKEASEKKTGAGDTDAILYDEPLLTSLISFYGESVLRKFQYFDKDVFNALKKQTNFAPKLNDSASLEDEFESENNEAANDALINSINALCEDCLKIEDSLDAYLRKLVVKVSYGLGRAVSPSLQTSAVAALTKLMMISHSFCEDNIQVLATIMEKASGETVRANAVLGFGDLIMRFPNILDPWTNHLYSRLKDNSTLVRTHSVVVLCHLITREMVKVRGQIAELCLCLEDTEPSIVNRVRLLFKNLSQKGNTLYNVVPDIISRLSNPERPDPVLTSVFNRILKYVLSLIGKERQNDLLVEKLCVRLREAETEAQWSQLSFCLSQLNYSEKSLRKLIECLPTLNERLLCTDVYNALQAIFTSASKAHFSKPQIKELATEGLSRLEELLTTKDDACEEGIKEEKVKVKEDIDSEELFVEPSTPRVPRSERKPSRSVSRSNKKAPTPLAETPRTTRARRKLK